VLSTFLIGWPGWTSASSGWRGFSPLMDDACNPVDNPRSDMTLSVLSSRRTSVTDSSVAVSSSDIRAQDKIIGFTMVLDTALE
jgi:hypothetical protein